MANIASAQTGNWDDPATWVGGVPPGDGDVATINAGHVVTIPAATTVTVGPSGVTGTEAIVVTGAGAKLVVNGTLNIKGDLEYTLGGRLEFGPGSVTTFIMAAGAQYFCRSVGTSPGMGIETLGVEGNWVTFQSDISAGGGALNACFDCDSISQYNKLNYTRFFHIGNASGARALITASNSSTNRTEWRHVIFEECGWVEVTGFAGGSYIDLEFVDFRNPLQTQTFEIDNADVARTSNIRRLANITAYNPNTAKKEFRLFCRDTTIDNIVLVNHKQTAAGMRGNIIGASGQGIFYIDTTNLAGAGNNDCLILGRNGANVLKNCGVITKVPNVHTIGETGGSFSGAGNIIEQCVFDGMDHFATDDGDVIIPADTGTPTMRFNILIRKAGTLFTMLLANAVITAINNTVVGCQAATIGESIGGATQCLRFNNNLIVNCPFTVRQLSAFVSQTNFDYDYNAYWNLTGGAGAGSGLGPETTAPWWADARRPGDDNAGLHNLNVDPMFVDGTRNADTWAQSLGGVGVADIEVQAIRINGVDENGDLVTPTTTYTLANFLAYIRQGYTPQNVALQAAGDPQDGGPDIGAVAVVPAAGGGSSVVGMQRVARGVLRGVMMGAR